MSRPRSQCGPQHDQVCPTPGGGTVASRRAAATLSQPGSDHHQRSRPANQIQPVRPSKNRVLFALFDLLSTVLSSVRCQISRPLIELAREQANRNHSATSSQIGPFLCSLWPDVHFAHFRHQARHPVLTASYASGRLEYPRHFVAGKSRHGELRRPSVNDLPKITQSPAPASRNHSGTSSQNRVFFALFSQAFTTSVPSTGSDPFT